MAWIFTTRMLARCSRMFPLRAADGARDQPAVVARALAIGCLMGLPACAGMTPPAVPEMPAGVPSPEVSISIPLPVGVLDQVGQWVFDFQLRNSHESKNKVYAKLVDETLQRVVTAAKRGEYAEAAKKFNWKVKVVQDNSINALAFPGGGVIVYTGLLEQVGKHTDQLGAVLGHEVVHALARHFEQRMSKELHENLVKSVEDTNWTTEGFSPEVAAGLLVALGAREISTILPVVRDQESQADHIGVELAAEGGYDPRGAIDFWKSQPPHASGGMLATHPSDAERIQKLENWLPDAFKLYEAAKDSGASASIR